MKIDLQALQKKLPIKMEFFDVIDSTSLYLARKIKERSFVPELVIADRQTNGQGRVGKKFYSPAATGLYLTFSFFEKDVLCDHVTPRIALAVSNAIFQTFGVSCGVKWVNDIYLYQKKIAGVLCQRVGDYFLFGIGINLLPPSVVPEELMGKLGYLLDTCSEEKCVDLIVSLYQNIVDIMNENVENVLDSYRKRCVHIGKKVQIEQDNKALSGKCLGIADDFSILIEIDNEPVPFSSGFLSLKI